MAYKFPHVTFNAAESRIDSVTASFDPASLVITQSVAWTASPSSGGERPQLDFSRAQGRRLSLLLRLEASAKQPSVQPDVDALSKLAMVMDDNGPEAMRRPPLVELVWPRPDSLPAFKGAIDRIEVRYLGISVDGTPQKADVLIEMQEASRLSFDK